MILILLGPQGSGKGTQLELIAKEFGLYKISMGQILREAGKEDPEIDRIINKEGALVPAKRSTDILFDYLKKRKIQYDFIIEGFPRMIDQYKIFKDWLKEGNLSIDLVIILELDKEKAIHRLSGRRMDKISGAIYNINTHPKPPANVKEEDLVQREDDRAEALEKRFQWYESEVLPLIDLMTKQEKVVKINADQEIEKVEADILVEISKLKNG